MSGGGRSSKSSLTSVRGLALSLITVVLLAGCGDSDPGPTVEELLELVEGRTLTSAEVTQKIGVGETLCQLDDAVLDAMWQRLSEDQLLFQDFVIAQLCPDRSVFYAGLTGRYVTEEAENSGIVASTTQVPAATETGDPDAESPGVEVTPTTSRTTTPLDTAPTGPEDTGPTGQQDTGPAGRIGPTTVPASADPGE